jgi:mono/diheme cytochrome c family protein
MKKILIRAALAVLALLALGAGGLYIAILVREDRTFDRPYPDLHASTDPAVIERGRYLAHGAAHCITCHGEDLRGGLAFHLPVGTFYARNITPDVETGIGRYTDPELARVLRHGVHPTGRAMLPFMPFADLADDDVVAVISYLRSRPAVSHRVPAHDVNLIGRFAKAFLLEPTGPSREVRRTVAKGPTAEYGAYLANSVANCVGCHTKRNLRTGGFIGEPFAGGMEMESHANGTRYVTPNLTPDPETGHIFAWPEDMFVQRFENAVGTDSPMPWNEFRTMTEDDLRALYRYLRTLPPVRTAKVSS